MSIARVKRCQAATDNFTPRAESLDVAPPLVRDIGEASSMTAYGCCAFQSFQCPV